MRSKRGRLFALGAATLILLGWSLPAQAESAPEKAASGLVIHYIADWHSRFDPWVRRGDRRPVGGASKLAFLLETRRRIASRHGLETIFLAAGDSFFGSSASSRLGGEPSRVVLEMMGLDVLALGVHDFDLSAATLFQLVDSAAFASLAANVSGPWGLPAWAVLEQQGLRIGVIGVLDGPHFSESLFELADPVETVQRLVDLRTTVDFLIVLSHCGEETDHKLAAIQGVDLVIGGRDHRLIEPRIGPATGSNDKAPVAHASSDGAYLGEAVVLPSREGWFLAANSFLPVRGILGESEAVKAYVEEMKNRLVAALDEPFAVVETALNREVEVLYGQESALGNLVADSMRRDTRAEIALINAGAIREGFAKGQVTDRHLWEALPFGNRIVVVDVAGRDLLRVFERSAEQAGSGGFFQVSGLKVTYGPEKTPRVWVDGQALEPDRRYRVAITDFLYEGGDGYEIFAEADPESEPTDRRVLEAVRRRMVSMGTVTARPEGRIIRFDSAVEEQP